MGVLLVWGGWYTFQLVGTQAPVSEEAGSRGIFFEQNALMQLGEQLTRGITSPFASYEPPIVTTEELGELSPAAGLVEIVRSDRAPSRTDVAREYIVLRAGANNAQPVNITGWSLQSMVGDSWYSIPQGAVQYRVGEVNELSDIYLNPGEDAIIATKVAPLGVAFRTNRCSGFLGSVQEFTPRLEGACISPRELLPPTVENITALGESCIAFAHDFPSCEHLTSTTRGFDTLSRACRDFLQPRLTYTFCADTHIEDADFYRESEWRVFLGRNEPVWREQYEVIRLLDEQGRTVDVFSY